MHIDRNRFLLLTAAMACEPSASQSQPVTVTIPASPSVASASPSTTPVASTKPTATSTRPVAPPFEEGDDDDTPTPVATTPALPTTPNCDNNKGTPAACTLKAAGPSCESFASTLEECQHVRVGLRPRVAEKVVACINAKSGKQSVCSYDAVSTCASPAVRSAACIDPSSASQCLSVVSQCRGRLKTGDCQALISAVTDKNKRAAMTCMTEFCSIDDCYYGMK